MPGISLDLLPHVPLFQALSVEQLSRLACGISSVRAARGELLFHKGDPCEGFHIVLSGQVKLSFTAPNGAEKVVEILSPGQSFGEAVMFMDQPYVVDAQALRDSLLLHVSKSIVLQEIRNDPEFACRMIAGLSRRLHGVVKDLESYSLRSGVQRVIGYLLSSGAESPDKSTPIEVVLPASKHLIASRLSLTPEYFSRVLHDLSAAGLITVEGRAVTILDAEGLRAHEA